MVEIDAELEFALEEPRLDEGDDIVLPLGAEGGAGAEFLAGPGEVPWLEEIEVGLTDFDEADQTVDGAEAGADRHVAGVLLFDVDDEVLAVGNVGRLGLSLDLLEEVQALEPMFAQLDLDVVVSLAGGDGQFAADDFVLGLGVAPNLDLLDVGLILLVYLMDGSMLPVSVLAFFSATT